MTAMAADTFPEQPAASGTDPFRAGRAPATREAHCTALLLLVPSLAEAAVLAGSPPGVTVLRTGMGQRRALAAAGRALRIPADAVAVAGFCGGLTAEIGPGDLVVATSVADDGRQQAAPQVPGAAGAPGHRNAAGNLAAALRARGVERVHEGRIVSSYHVVRGAERVRFAAGGALAVDMESAWLQAAAAGRPFAVLRAVLDTPSTRLSRPCATTRDLLLACRALRRAAPALLDWAHAVSPPEQQP